MSAKSDSRQQRLTGLDGLRALAAIAVALLHVGFYTARPHPMESFADALMQALRLGVPMFFVLSGFLLYLPWVRATRDCTPAPDVRAYALKRAARILPAYYVALIGATIILVAAHDPHVPSASQALSIAALSQNWWPDAAQKLDPPAWTLAVEETFYIVLPLIGVATVRWLRSRRAQLVGCAALVVASVAANALVWALGHSGWHRTLPGVGYDFALGMAVAVIFPGVQSLSRRTRLALIAGGCLLVLADAWSHAPLRLAGWEIWQDLPAAVGFAAIVLAAATARRNQILSWRPLAWVGERSYGLYLWHFPVILLLHDVHLLPGSMVAASIVVIGIALAAAAGSWQFVERPALRRARELSARPDDTRPARRRRSARTPRSVRASTTASAALARGES